jgi:predicted metal-dependent phosphoesterase TrpH
MKESYVDLHIHTTCSDGIDRPEEIPGLAEKAGLKAVAITDHDTVRAIERALQAASPLNIEVIPGVELSTMLNDSEIHILGYFMDWQNRAFGEKMRELKEGRLFRAKKMVARLKKLGINLHLDQVLQIAGEGVVGRPHIADALVREGVVSSYSEAFNRYIGQNGPAYVSKRLLSPVEAIDLIGRAGGVPVLAHPATMHKDEFIPLLVKWGLKGIETVHPMHTPQLIRHYKEISQRYNLVCTGGSDYHGKDRLLSGIGKYKVTYQTVETLKRLSSFIDDSLQFFSSSSTSCRNE